MSQTYLAGSGRAGLLQPGRLVFFGFPSELHLGFQLVYQGLEDTNTKTETHAQIKTLLWLNMAVLCVLHRTAFCSQKEGAP